MANLKLCDICDKQVDEEDAYEVKLKKNSTKLTKVADLCHQCADSKGFLGSLEKRKWKKWNPKTFSWETPEN